MRLADNRNGAGLFQNIVLPFPSHKSHSSHKSRFRLFPPEIGVIFLSCEFLTMHFRPSNSSQFRPFVATSIHNSFSQRTRSLRNLIPMLFFLKLVPIITLTIYYIQNPNARKSKIILRSRNRRDPPRRTHVRFAEAMIQDLG